MDQQSQVNTGTSLDSVIGSINDPGERAILSTVNKSNEEEKVKVDKGIDKMETEPRAKPPELTQPPKQADYQTDPMKTFGSSAMFLATFGSLLTRHPLLSALNAGANVMNAANKKDAASFTAAYDTWKTQSENAWKNGRVGLETI